MTEQALLAGLNAAQQEAVTHGEGPLLVLAGAGSGKTRVITHRVAHLIRSGAPPEGILALAFTNKAAREVAERVRGLIGSEEADGLTVSTFHSLGHRILRAEIRRLGFDSRFTLFTESDQRALVREIVREKGLPLDAADVLDAIGVWKNRGLAPEQVDAPAGDGRSRAFRGAYASYQALLRAQNAVDFDDLLLLPLRVFRENPDCQHYWQRIFSHLLVDEYQDTNPVQFELLKALSGASNNLCVVGDDDQSIYGWRGAEVGLILRFEEHFPGAKVVFLEENYRSTQTILEAAHAVVSRIQARKPKKLWTDRGRGEPVGWIEAEDGAGEADEVAGTILAESHRTRRPWSEFAVLVRTNAQTREFEHVFRSHGIPYRVVGGSRFFDRKDVRDLIAYLRAIHNPRDTASLVRIANVPKRGLGPQSLLKLRERTEATGESFRQALGRADDLSPPARAGARNLLTLLENYGRRFRAEGVTPAVLRDFCSDSGLKAEIEAQCESRQEMNRRLELLEQFADSAFRAREIDGKADLGLYLETLGIDPPRGESEEDVAAAVTLMTLHSAKGLEFPVVFLTGLEEGLLPHLKRSGASARFVDEERRLCYVGMTRARERLFLCHAKARRRRGIFAVSMPSRFLAEIPLELTDSRRETVRPNEEEEKAQARDFFRDMRELLS